MTTKECLTEIEVAVFRATRVSPGGGLAGSRGARRRNISARKLLGFGVAIYGSHC